jgi:ferredoxin-NADP reductase
MAMSVPAASERGGVRDHRFHPLRVRRVVTETDETRSFVLDVPDDLGEAFRYRAGQFCTFRVWIDGQPHLRCYSMSSTPAEADFQVTVKRVPGGLVSNRMIDTLRAGDGVEATCPAGVFCLTPGGVEGGGGGDLVAFAAGSGITPVISLVKEALDTTARRVRLLYANRDRASTIFAAGLDALAQRYPDRLELGHHLDVEHGFVDAAAVRGFAAGAGRGAGASGDADLYICGPPPFMDIVEGTLLADGVGAERIHIERFTPPAPVEDPVPADVAVPAPATQVTIELGGRRGTTEHRPGTTILQTARQLGMAPPFSCESGSCATCMAKVVEGSVAMHVNNALTDDEVDEGWVLTCQSVPTSATVHVVYEP